MILVDTNIWIQHFRKTDEKLIELLSQGRVILHEWIIGELALGQLKKRSEILLLLDKLPFAKIVSSKETLHMINQQKLFSRGIGWVDAQLLSVCFTENLKIWTEDKSLKRVSKFLKIAYEVYS